MQLPLKIYFMYIFEPDLYEKLVILIALVLLLNTHESHIKIKRRWKDSESIQ